MQFPTLTTKDLNGKSVTFPDDFGHDFNLLFIGYLRYHQRDIDSWMPHARQLETKVNSLRFYELPVVGEMGFFGRKQLDFWMQRGIPDPDTRSRTLTYYVDRAAFRAALGLETEEQIGVVLVDRQGKVLWKTYGGFSPEAAQALQAALADQSNATAA